MKSRNYQTFSLDHNLGRSPFGLASDHLGQHLGSGSGRSRSSGGRCPEVRGSTRAASLRASSPSARRNFSATKLSPKFKTVSIHGLGEGGQNCTEVALALLTQLP